MSRAAKVVRDARKRAGLTQVELARRSGIAQNVISDYERGKREPSFGAVDILVNAAGLKIEFTPLSELDRIRRRRDEIVELLAAHGLTNVGVFGSVARGEETGVSDIDLLVDVRPDTDLLRHHDAQVELELPARSPRRPVPRAGLKPNVAPAVARDVVML